MARTRGAEADATPPVEEEVLGPEDATEDEVEDVQADADADGGDGVDADGQEGEEGQEDEVADEPPAPRRSGGGSETIRAQRRARQEAEAEAARLRQELAEARGFQQGIQARQVDPQTAARAEQEFYQRLSMLPPEEAHREVIQRGRQEFGAALQQIEFRSNDRADKQAYDIAARTDPLARKYQAQVEQILSDERRQGRNPDRETILDVLVGRETREKARAATPGQRNGAARRVASQQTRPTGARGDVAAKGRRPQPGSLEADIALVEAAIARGESVF